MSDTRAAAPVDEQRVREIVTAMLAERPPQKPAPRFHLFHRWAPWSKAVVTNKGRVVQWRICTICGLEQDRWA